MMALETHPPMFSIIVICYNYAHLLPIALKKIEEQTFRDFEVVFVDNGSVDDSVPVFENWIEQNPDIRIVKVVIDTNRGIAGGRNAGLRACAGTYLLFNDPDDYMISPVYLEKVADIIRRQGSDMVYTNVKRVNEKGEIYDSYALPSMSNTFSYPSYQGVVYKADIFRDHVVTPPIYFEDFYGAILFGAYANSAAYLGTVDYAYYTNLSSVSMSGEVKAPSALDDVFTLFEKDIPPMDSEKRLHYEYACIRHYYSFLLTVRQMTFAELAERYKILRNIMEQHYPDYLKNRDIRLIRSNGYTGHFKKNVWLMACMERLDQVFHTSFFIHALLKVYRQTHSS